MKITQKLMQPWTTQDTKAFSLFMASLTILMVVFYAGTIGINAMSRPEPFPFPSQAYLLKLRPLVPIDAFKYSRYRTGPIEVAKVFGRSHGCQDADLDFILDVSNAAVKVGLDPRLFASTIATESSCNQFATSSRGAIGLTQVVPMSHKTDYDFSQINLLNRKDNLRVGAEILAGNVRQWGTASGVTHYQGMAIGCNTCDDQYTSKVLKLTDGK